MGLGDIVSWYQKKIGTYDKQQWEKTIEQRILHGLTHVPMKATKLKTDYIDVDLVRGSSFPKAKPKHGFVTVARLGTLRLLFLPLYTKWWVKQTSPRVFALLLVLYLLQLINTAIYTLNSSATSLNDSKSFPQSYVPLSEILVPFLMMLILSIIHSQIVSTNPGPENRSKLSHPKTRKLKSRRSIKKLRQQQLQQNQQEQNKRPGSCDSKTSQELDALFTPKKIYQSSPQQNNPTDHVKRVKIQGEETIIPKRNVAWDSPVKCNIELDHSVETSETEPYVSANEAVVGERRSGMKPDQPLDDDGFESLNGNGSSENSVEVPPVNPPIENLVADEEDNKTETVTISGEGKEKCEAWVKHIESSSSLLRRRRSAPDRCRSTSTGNDSDSGPETNNPPKLLIHRRDSLQERKSNFLTIMSSTVTTIESSGCDSEEEGECCEELSSPGTGGSCCPLLTEATTSATEWIGVTTNSEDCCTYSSEYDETDSHISEFNTTIDNNNQSAAWDFDLAATVILNPSCAPSDKVSCTIWTNHDVKKADLTVLDISSAIIERVEAMPDIMDYFYGGIVLSIFLACLPAICRLGEGILETHTINETQISIGEFITLIYNEPTDVLMDFALGPSYWQKFVMVLGILQRWILGSLFFFLLAVAERTFKQRFLYAKLFLHLTSSRRARKSNLPHFRLNKVRNIKTWLSVRSYLKKRGPQRSVDMIVSAAFIISLLLLSFICVELLKDSVALHSQYNLEVMFWTFSIGIYILRFMTLGAKINRKYRNLSVLITEQINLYLQIEQKPHKKDELMVANSVLKLAADLLKELESPFKISGLSANPYLYTVTKVVILSALSGVLSEMLGFKLKLLKIKFK